jgi:hypothetical protein
VLRTVETLAEIHDEITSFDLDARFEKAIKALCNETQNLI